MKWVEIYREKIEKRGGIKNYIELKRNSKHEFYDLISKYTSGVESPKVLEAGCGSGAISTILAGEGYKVTAVDIDPEVIQLAEEISEGYGKAEKPNFIRKSILELDFEDNSFDISFSNGVLEHFPDEEIIHSLKDQLRVAKIVIFGIPTTYFDVDETIYGDERSLALSYWRELITKAGGTIIEEERFHNKPIFKRIFDFKRYFRPFPFRIFVVKRK